MWNIKIMGSWVIAKLPKISYLGFGVTAWRIVDDHKIQEINPGFYFYNLNLISLCINVYLT